MKTGLLVAVFFVGFALIALGCVVVLVIVLARKMAARTDACWGAVAAELGLVYSRDTELKSPRITGTLDRVTIEVGTTKSYQTIMRSDSSHQRVNMWTQVTASPELSPLIEVWLRSNDAGKREGLGELPTGDGAFDAEYRLMAPPGADPQLALPPGVRAAMLDAPRQVQIVGGQVVWTNSFHDSNPERLAGGVRSCAAVAAAIDAGR